MKKLPRSFYPGSGNLSKRLLGNVFRKFLLVALTALCFIGVQAQDKVHVTGIVKDDKGVPSPNTSVMVKGTKTGATTDANGAFSIEVPNQNSTMIISNAAFETQEMVVGNTKKFYC